MYIINLLYVKVLVQITMKIDSMYFYELVCVCVCLTPRCCVVQEVKKLEGRLEKVSCLVAWVNQEEALFKFQVSSFPLLTELKVGTAATTALIVTTHSLTHSLHPLLFLCLPISCTYCYEYWCGCLFEMSPVILFFSTNLFAFSLYSYPNTTLTTL